MTDFLERARGLVPRPLVLPNAYLSPPVTLDGIREVSIAVKVRDYLQNFYELAEDGIGTLFCGRAGSYKSYGAAVIAKTVHEKLYINVDFVDCGSELPKLDRMWYEGYADRRMKELASSPLVVLDDFTEARPTGRERQILTEIIRDRFNSKLPTLYTANLTITNKDDAVATIDAVLGLTTRRRIAERSAGFGVMVR